MRINTTSQFRRTSEPRWRALASLLGLGGLLFCGGPARGQLLHRYQFTTGSANDTVGTANGTLYGTATVSSGALVTTGITGALQNGVPQNCAGLPASVVAGITNAFSLEAWFQVHYNGGYCTLFSFSDGTTGNYLLATPAAGYSPYPSRTAVKGGGGNAAEQLANQIYCDDTIMHDMTVTFDGTNVTYYLDGTLQSYAGLENSFQDLGLNLSRLTYVGIGGGSPFADDTLEGQVYDFRIYGQALTLPQVAAIYALGTNAANPALNNAIASPLPAAQVPLSGSLQRMPFFGSPFLHDPGTMRKEGGSYYIYGDGDGVLGITSTDLRNWSPTSPVFPNGPPAWTTNAVPGGTPNYFWAPDLAYFNGLWHLYYAYSQWGTVSSVIGLATSTTLSNAVWTDQGKVVESSPTAGTNVDTSAYNCIDPGIYVAPNGTVWMTFGSYSSGILVTEINPATGLRLTTSSLAATLVANNAPGGGWGSTEEGSCLYQHGGYWYLFVNWGGCCQQTYSTYNIRVGRASSPTGPYYDKKGVALTNGGGTMFLESTARYIGPGHAAICDDNGTNWFTYHFYDDLAGGAPTVGMDQLYWSADGWPVMTNDWSVLYPLTRDANESGGLYNGTLQGSGTFTNDPAHGGALRFDGATASVALPLSVGNASTVAAWVNWIGGAAWQRIFDFGNDTTNYWFLTPAADTGVMRFAITTNGPGGEQQINAGASLPSNSWHHVAVTLDGASGVLYLDGAAVGTNPALNIRPWQTTPHNNNIGKSQFAANPLYSGEISSFRIFGRALAAAEISSLYTATPTLAHRYSFSSNQPAAVWDSIGMGHGTLMGGAALSNGLSLNGTAGTYANLPGGLVSGCSAVTLEFWGSFGVNSSLARVFDTGNTANGGGQNYFFYTPHSAAGGQEMILSTTNSGSLINFGTLDNRTVHIAAICDPASNYMAFYTNGALAAQESVTLPPLTDVASDWSFIGKSLFSANPYLNGTLTEVRLYDGHLTPQQIAADDLAGPKVLAPQSAQPTNLLFNVLSNTLNLTWPADHLGWILQQQIVPPGAGLSGNWVDLPASATATGASIAVSPSNAVFYRLRFP